jgi:transposase
MPLLDAIPPIRGLRGRTRSRPRRLFADRGYDFDKYRRLVRARGITPKIARRGTPHGSGLGRTRWVVERTLCATRRSVCIPGSAGRNSEGGSWAG